MRRALLAGLLLLPGTVAYAAPDASPVIGAQANNPGVDAVLDGLDQVGRNLKEFSGKVKLIESDEDLGTSTTRLGKVWYQKKGDAARMRVTLDQRIGEGAGGRKLLYKGETVEYLLDGPWLTDRDYHTHNETKRQVLKPGQKMDLFKLGEGPFPMPIGQNKKDVHRLFEVQSVPAAKDDPAGTVHLQFMPRKGTDLARKFYSIDVWTDAKTYMPRRIDTLDKDRHMRRSTELSDLDVNPKAGLADADFELPNIDNVTPRWDRHVEAYAD